MGGVHKNFIPFTGVKEYIDIKISIHNFCTVPGFWEIGTIAPQQI